ncbi:hypothetical protein CERZMDRAFT_94561 [Cercospora zeae-maydis SCOH1-5]|uniref:F-box domain-containing protein n=1 Tax=Cercospora zeae-maydis SCOH1-5 TaxID=717836 RepID=A0A6A6FNV5_9PEZI|nr:hypothetical protein CERZMDRAFT_94561 [Cercospora zeae-maydis SCOH1-5]
MPDFWDLPRKVRDKIYRMHLVHNDPVTEEAHEKMCRGRKALGHRQKQMPMILQVSPRADREAAPVYYGENHFIISRLDPAALAYRTLPRHTRMVRRVTCDWIPDLRGVSYAFEGIAKLKGLRELNIRVDEKDMVRQALNSRDKRPHYATFAGEPSAQEQLALYRHPGINGLLSLKGIPNVNFIPRRVNGKDSGGPIAGGVLLTQIRPRITAPVPKGRKGKTAATRGSSHNNMRNDTATHFDFLGLPAELRNRVYEFVLCVGGPLNPSKKPPSSTAKNGKSRDDFRSPESALCLLAVNKQIRNEAVGIYYATPLVFYFSTQFHAFAVDLGQLRRSVICDITIHYDNINRGDVDSAELTASLLRDFTGLKKLQIIMWAQLSSKIRGRSRWDQGWKMDRANPALIPGMKGLFSLRNIQEIKVRDIHLEEMYETARKDKEFPKFEVQSRSYQVMKLTAALEHFNKALLDAQKGRVNLELLEDNGWHTWDDFPELAEDEGECDEEDEADDEECRADVETEFSDVVDVSVVNTLGNTPAHGLRRSARLSAKAAIVPLEQQDVAEDTDVDFYEG